MVDQVQGQSFYTNQAHFARDRMAGSVPKWNHVDAVSGSQNTPKSSLINPGTTTPAPAPRLSFGELLDVVNPLHHIPIVGSVYRTMTGDEISSVARIAGGGLYGGGVGVATALASAAIEEHSGKDIIGNILEAETSKTYSFDEEPRTAGLKKEITPAPMEEIASAKPPRAQTWNFNA